MKMTPAIKGQITRKLNALRCTDGIGPITRAIRSVLEKQMPKEQAKHAAKKQLVNFTR
jgi:hypothetical protein